MASFICWRKISERTRLISKSERIKIIFIKSKIPFIGEFFKTFFKLNALDPKEIILQLPQGPLLLSVVLYKIIFRRNFKITADCHTGFLIPYSFREFLLNYIFRWLLRFADKIWIHNKTILEVLPKYIKIKAEVKYDPLPYKKVGVLKARDKIIAVWPCTWKRDDPILEVIKAFKRIYKKYKNIVLYITGKYPKKLEKIVSKLKKYNIILTGFLSKKKFNELLKEAHIVLGLTKQEYTFVHAAWEGYSLGKIIIVSDTKTMHEVFDRYNLTVFVKNSVKDIEEGLEKALSILNFL